MSAEGPTDVNAYARHMHESAVLMVRKMLDDPRAVVLASTLDEAGLPRRFVLLKVSDGSIVRDVAADPEANAGPTSYAAVLETLDVAVGELDLLRTTRTGLFRTTAAAFVVWDPRFAKLAVRRLLHRDGGLLTGRETRRYPWLKADWKPAGTYYTWWYGDPAPAPSKPPKGKLGVALLAGKIGQHVHATAQSLPGETGDAEADARRVLALLREIAAGTAPVSPSLPT